MTEKSGKAPGKYNRNGISVLELFEMFPDEESARKWFEEVRWPDNRRSCGHCGSIRTKAVKMKSRCRIGVPTAAVTSA